MAKSKVFRNALLESPVHRDTLGQFESDWPLTFMLESETHGLSREEQLDLEESRSHFRVLFETFQHEIADFWWTTVVSEAQLPLK